MKVTKESKKGLKTNLKVFMSKKEVDEKISTRLEEISKTINLKGFRPGKVPVDVLKKQYGKAIYGEVLDKILKESSTQAIQDNKIRVAGQPKIDLKSFGEDKDLEYVIQIDELPKIKVKAIEELKITNYHIKISDEEIDKKIKEIAKNQNNFVDKKDNETSQNGDLVIFDYEATVDEKTFEGGNGKNTQVILGKDLFIKNFDKQLIGVKKNQEKIVEVNLPENFPNKEYSNKKAKFNCKIINIRKPTEVKINDEFAKSLGAKDLNDLKIAVGKQTKDQYKNTLDSITKKEILDQLDKFKEIDIPENLIEQEVAILSQEMKEEEKIKNKTEHEKQAKKRIKVGLILNEFGEQNNLKVSDQEVQGEIQKQIRMMPGQEKQVMEYFQKNPSAASQLKGSLYEDKIISLIKEKAKSINKTVTREEAEKIILGKVKDSKKEESETKKTSSKEKTIKKKAQKAKKVSKK